jgi:cell division protein FtsZ
MAIIKEGEELEKREAVLQHNTELAAIDRELEELLKKQLAKVKVFGIGGGGGNTLSRMKEIGIKGCEMIAINTDAQDLLYTEADYKILIGKELTQGLGAGSNPRVGEEAAHESEQELKKKLASTDMIFITCGLGGGCLRGSSLIYTNPEGPVRIDSISQGSTVLSFDDGKLVKRKVLAAMKTGVKKVLQVKTKNHSLHASFDHPFLKVVPERLDKEGKFYDFDLKWMPAESLQKGDLVLTLRQINESTEGFELEGFNINEDFCRLFGFLLGDGWITNSKDSWKLYFSPSKDKEMNEKYLKLIKEIFNLEMKFGGNWYYANSKHIYELLEKLGFKKHAKEKEIPKWIFGLPSTCIKEFILGLADADGFYYKQIKKDGKEKNEIRFEMSSEKLIKQLKVLCDYIGLRTSNVSSRTRKIKVPSTKKEGLFSSWDLRIYKIYQLNESLEQARIRKGIGLLYQYHRRMKKHKPEIFNNFAFERIQEVNEIGEEDVYDITVEGSHNFIADGFVVHNTGTGAAPVIAELAKKAGALVVGVVTVPFSMEGKKRIENAMYGLERLEGSVDTLIVIPNDKLLELAPELPLQTAFKVADEILTNAVKGITELVTKSGLVNLDFADVKAVMMNGGVSLIGMGESDSQHRALDAVDKAITNPLLDVDISNATGALINIIGGPDLTLDEAKIIVSTVGEKLSPDAKMIWGAQISDDLEHSLRVMLIVTGVKSSQIVGTSSGQTPTQKKQSEMSNELGIEFLE